LTLWLWHLDPPSVVPLVSTLSAGLAGCTTADYLRFTFPAFREYWELYFGFLMRESERDKVNGVVWYLIGVIWVLVLYPRDIAVVAILTYVRPVMPLTIVCHGLIPRHPPLAVYGAVTLLPSRHISPG
jgi:hypothetical protein